MPLSGDVPVFSLLLCFAASLIVALPLNFEFQDHQLTPPSYSFPKKY